MDASISSWFVILLAALAANLPFLNERLFGVLSIGTARKSLWIRLFELLVLYFLVRSVAYLLESRMGNVFPQHWEFYAITGCLFLVFAFPGFVGRYLHKHHG